MHASCKCSQVFIKESYYLLRSFCMYESAKNELKENKQVLVIYLMLTLAGYFFQNMNVTQAATPPAKWITHGYFVIELQTVKLVPTDQPALNILPPRQFCSLIG